MSVEIPLPPLSEQQRLVARIEELARRVEEARGLRREAVEEAEQLISPMEIQIWPDASLLGAPTLAEVSLHLSRGRQSKQGESSHYLIKTQHVQMGRYLPTKMTLDPDVALMTLKSDEFAEFSSACSVRSAARNEMDTDAPTIAPPEIDIQFVPETSEELDPPVNVIVHNDDVTPMNFVVEVLRTVFELSRLRATRVMLEAHYNGKALVVTLGREEAKFRVGQAHSLARAAGYPLSFTIEPV